MTSHQTVQKLWAPRPHRHTPAQREPRGRTFGGSPSEAHSRRLNNQFLNAMGGTDAHAKAEAYLQQVSPAVNAALMSVMKERPADPIKSIGEKLLAHAAAEEQIVAELPTVSAPVSSPSAPCAVSGGPVQLRIASEEGGRLVGYNHPSSMFDVKTEYFTGRIYYRLKGLEFEPSAYFASRSCRMSAVVQGRFTRDDLTMGDCLTGYEFGQPLRNLPSKMLMRGLLRVAHALAPTLSEDLLGAHPFIYNPLFQTVQVLDVAADAASAPDITAHNLPEERTALLGGVFAAGAAEGATKGRVSAAERKRYFQSRVRGASHPIDPTHVYTMEFSEDKIEPSTFELLILGMRLKLSRFLGDQPLPYPMGKLGGAKFGGDASDCYLFNVHVHHQPAA